MKHTDSQRERLKQHFDSGRSVTRLTAFIDLGICELSSRIGELEKTGYPIDRTMIEVVNRYGETVRVMEYKKRVCPVCGSKFKNQIELIILNGIYCECLK